MSCHLAWIERQRGDRGSQDTCKTWFLPRRPPPLPAPLPLVCSGRFQWEWAGEGAGREKTRPRLPQRSHSKQGGCASPGKPAGLRLRPRPSSGHFSSPRPSSDCSRQTSHPVCPRSALSEPRPSPPGLESAPGSKLISLPLHDNCAASQVSPVSGRTEHTLPCHVEAQSPQTGPFSQLESQGFRRCFCSPWWLCSPVALARARAGV